MVMSIARTGSSGALLADQLLERAPGQVLHRDVVRVVVGAAVVHGDDVRVVESRGRLRLTAEALDEARIRREAPSAPSSPPGAQLAIVARYTPAIPPPRVASRPRSAHRSACPGRVATGHWPPRGARITGGDRRGHLTAEQSRGLLDRDRDRDLRVLDRRETDEPRLCQALPVVADLRGPGLAGDRDVPDAARQSRCPRHHLLHHLVSVRVVEGSSPGCTQAA